MLNSNGSYKNNREDFKDEQTANKIMFTSRRPINADWWRQRR